MDAQHMIVFWICGCVFSQIMEESKFFAEWLPRVFRDLRMSRYINAILSDLLLLQID